MIAHLLNRFGLDASGTVIESAEYQGHGWHATDPCFKGRYVFTDHRRRIHTARFTRHPV